MARYPLLFGWRDFVTGNGFVAEIALEGRALLVNEGDGFWMYGVNPGGISGGGKGPAEAQSHFRAMYRSVLADIAAEAASLEDFRQEVENLFETNAANLAEWEAAVGEVRAGKTEADWLPQRPAESKRGIYVLGLQDDERAIAA